MTTYYTARMLGVFSHDGTLRSLHQSADDAAYLTRQTGGYAEARDVLVIPVEDDAAPLLDAACIPDATLSTIARTLRGEVRADREAVDAIKVIGPARLKLCAKLCASLDADEDIDENDILNMALLIQATKGPTP